MAPDYQDSCPAGLDRVPHGLAIAYNMRCVSERALTLDGLQLPTMSAEHYRVRSPITVRTQNCARTGCAVRRSGSPDLAAA